TSYNPETDADNLFSSANTILIETEDGFYWSSAANFYLLFYDNALEEMIPVCSRPECEHFPGSNVMPQNFDCDAYLEAGRHPALYQGKIYYTDSRFGKPNPNIGGDRLGARLMRMNPDGTGKEFIKDLFPSGYGDPQWLILHRGNLYGMSIENDVDKDGAVIGKTSIVVIPIEGQETTFKTIYEIDCTGWGSMRFIGDYCYFWINYQEGDYYINEHTGEVIDEQVSGGVAGRWSSVADETEILYQGNLPKDEAFYMNAWVEQDGTFYVPSSLGLIELEDGELTVVQSFEEEGKEFVDVQVSDCIAIARTVPAAEPFGECEIWVCRFDGSTVYKGPLPLDWFYEDPAFESSGVAPRTFSFATVVGDETGLWCEFVCVWPMVGNANYLVRFDFADGGIQAKLYGSFIRLIDFGD
ncbi:MAG: hypothetical protein J5544_03875, partial [Clostridia bacterium]|nr:hypothetical protein [Clostridia bacterium]